MIETTPHTTSHTTSPTVRVAALGSARFGRQLSYLLSGLPIGIAAFTTLVIGFALAAGTIVIWVGLPVLAATLTLAGHFARLERRQVAAVTGRELPAPAYLSEGGRLRAISDPQAWRDFAHALVSFPLRVISFALTVAWTVGAVSEALYATWAWSIPRDESEDGLLELMFGIDSYAADVAFNTAIGVVLLATAVPVIRALAAAQTGLARAMLGGGGGR
jgi:hypothetical protein